MKDNDVCVGGYIGDTYDQNGTLINSQENLLNITQIDDTFPLNNHNKLFALCMSLWNKIYNLKLIQQHHLRFDEKVSFGEDGLFNTEFFIRTNKISFLDYAGYHYIRRQRVSLSTKAYDDFLGIKFRALKRRCELLNYWGIREEKINSFKSRAGFKIIWHELGNIKSERLARKLKLEKISKILNNKNLVEVIKQYKPNSKKEKLKKIILLSKNATILYWIIGK